MKKENQYLTGQLLLDGGKLFGSFFHQSVVLICEHNSEGAFGLILNRSSGKTLGELLAANLGKHIKSQTLYIGGPVQPGALSYIFPKFSPSDNKANIMDVVEIGHSLHTLDELDDAFGEDQKIRLFAGYAGWSPGQLEDEIKRQAWVPHPATFDLVFSESPHNLWRAILKQKGTKYRLLAEAPENPSLN
ncbi:MAG: YqgE/AlgH family protein [Verrucomicrobia bacterium]|nr:YqgE/AlgH family protein [Verrucomicrobiota bacterium]